MNAMRSFLETLEFFPDMRAKISVSFLADELDLYLRVLTRIVLAILHQVVAATHPSCAIAKEVEDLLCEETSNPTIYA